MRGFIFEYYKYVRYPKESMEDIRGYLNYKEADRSILTFGEYDRLKINNITKFERFRDLSSLAKDWVGNRQSILLYDSLQEPEFIYVENDNELGFMDVGKNAYDQHLFWALTEFPFCSGMRDSMGSYDELLQNAREILQDIIEKECKSNAGDCRYMILGSLGNFGIYIFWLSDQYTDILRIVNNIKCKSTYQGKRMYLAAHTMFSRNPVYDTADSNHELVSKLQGKAYIQITLKKGIDSQLVFIKPNDTFRNVYHTSGEYDLLMEMDARDAYVCFEKNEILNHDKDSYQNIILQTRVTLTREPENGVELEEPVQEEQNNSINELVEVKEEYRSLRKVLKRHLDKTAGMVDTLDMLHCDYRYNVASAINQNWEADFSYIFLKNLQCINQMVPYIDNQKIDFLDLLDFILNNLKQQIFHISEANSLNFEVPKCHLRYTGQEDSILFGYMGIIKEILKTAYQLEGFNKQSEIIPIVTVDTVPVIDSELYPDISRCVGEKEKDQEFKILSLNLPHVTFYDIPMHIQYLYHEVYHYIVPRDREYRDYVTGILNVAVFVRSVLNKVFLKLFDGSDDMVRWGLEYIQPVIYDTVIQDYQEIHVYITEFYGCKKKRETDCVLLISERYREKLKDYLLCDTQPYIETLICKLNDKLSEGSFQGISFASMPSYLENLNKQVDVGKLKEWFGQEGRHVGKGELEACITIMDKISAALEEISADIPMIELSKMPLAEYLLTYAHCLKNELQKPQSVDMSDELKEFVRLGVVLDFYEQEEERLDETKDSFIYIYVAKYIDFSKEGFHDIGQKLQERREEAEDWFAYFFKCWMEYKEQYALYKEHFRRIVETSQVKARVQNYDIEEKCNFYFKEYRAAYGDFIIELKKIEQLCWDDKESERVMELCRQSEEKFHSVIFSENIKLINHFQKQDKLTDLLAINKEWNKKKEELDMDYEPPEFSLEFSEKHEEAIRLPKWKIMDTVYELKDFWKRIEDVSKELELSCKRVFGRGDYALWYRGQSNSVHGLLPSIMRKNLLERQKFHYLSQYQRYLYEEFKHRADGAPEVMDRSYYGISDYLALMQHYRVKTNLMDWSEDAFTGLYFALEQLITQEKKGADTSAAVYIFSPHLYNEARRTMIEMAAKATSCTEPAYLASRKTAQGKNGLIPNIAASYNSKVYDMFLIGNLDYESENRYGYINEMALEGKEEFAFLPLAVYTSRLNPRIRSQSGIFVAYNLYTEPSRGADAYSYMDLEKVQKYYLETFEGRKKEKFLYKVIIDKKAAKEMAACLRRMGISKEKIYPELANIGEKIR
ncbi:FRG domain-containing protein [Lachnospiraceae bacterium 29-84]